MALIFCTECGKQYSDKARACPNCGCPTDDEYVASLASTPPKAPTIQDAFPRDQVVQHLHYATELEKTLYTYRMTHEKLESRIQSLGHPQRIYPPKPLSEYGVLSPFWTVIPAFLIALIILSLSGGDFLSDLISVLTVILIFFNSDLLQRAGIALLIGVAVGVLFVLIKLFRSLSKISKQTADYEAALAQDHDRVMHERNLIRHLREQQASIKSQFDSTARLLQKLYAMDILFPKYRHMVAVITMLEYFRSGRCLQLTGHEGAYNLYENEEKMNVIVGKLDTAISLLSDIKHSQHMLYEAICETNDNMLRIQSQSERLLELGGRIAENTALTTYNTDVIRRNTSISAYVNTFYRR